MVTYPNINQ